MAKRSLWSRKFVYIPSPDDEYLGKGKLFGDSVFDDLLDARQDIEDVANAMASGLHTAAVFHGIRASEYGLRAIAIELGVELTDKGQPIPLEYGDWNKIIVACNGKITEARKLPNDQQKNERIQRLSDCVGKCERILDLWRNDVCHTRTRYSQVQAKAALETVGEFLQLVCSMCQLYFHQTK
jgi:hypothetical protein